MFSKFCLLGVSLLAWICYSYGYCFIIKNTYTCTNSKLISDHLLWKIRYFFLSYVIRVTYYSDFSYCGSSLVSYSSSTFTHEKLHQLMQWKSLLTFHAFYKLHEVVWLAGAFGIVMGVKFLWLSFHLQSSGSSLLLNFMVSLELWKGF